jgi:rod shape-determining protein MreC
MRFKSSKFSDVKDYVITALLLVIALSLMIARNQGGIDSLRKVSVTTFSLLEMPLSNIRIYREALNTNTYLHRQNILLQDELSRLRAIRQENERLRSLLGYESRSDYDLVPVLVVGKKLNGKNNTLTVDAGTEQGIKVGMPLVTSDGLAGKVIITSKNYSLVMPYYNVLFRVSARVQENNAVGIISWTGTLYGQLVMDFVPKTVSVEPDFIIETSGSSNQYPPGIPIGLVTGTEPEEGRETQQIFVKPFVSLEDIAQGFLIKFQPDTSISRLENDFNEVFE